MTVAISLLRGVNVGGHNKVKMDALRSLFQSLHLVNPRTHIQSGNVIFATKEKDMDKLAARISAAIEKELTVRCEVVIRSMDELRDVIGRNPFAGRADVPPNKLVVTFLARDPGAEARDRLGKLQGGPEELHLDGRELYIYFPNGISGSKIPLPVIDRAMKVPGTARNWNTVTKLLELAQEI